MAKPFGTFIAQCPKCRADIGDAHPFTWCVECGEQLPHEIVAKLRAQIGAAAPMGVKVIEFKAENDYRAWLQRMGIRIRVVNVSTTKRWSPWTGFLGDSKTYTVTYEEAEIGTSAARTAAQHCSNCGSPLRAPAKFCSQCGKQIG
jgi:predicted amidophosphoribosyltransferase